MSRLGAAALSLALALAAGRAAATQYHDTVTGDETKSYTVAVGANQTLSVLLTTSSIFVYFDVTPVGSSQAIWIGTVENSRRPFQQKLEKAGDYRIDVFLVRAEARRGGKADFALDVSVGP